MWAKRLSGIAILATILSTAGCAEIGQGDIPDRALPPGVVISVLQTRSDVVARKLVVRIENGSNSSLTVTGVELSSGQFAEPAVWPNDSTEIEKGRTVDLRMALPEPACDDPEPVAIVRMDVDIRGIPMSVDVTPIDESGRLAQLRATECFAASVADVVSIEAITAPREVTRGGLLLAELDLSLNGSGTTTSNEAAGDPVIVSAAGTTLFTLSDPVSGEAVSTLPFGMPLTSRSAATLTLLLQPTRCDPHAIAEDKRGTIFPLRMLAPDATEGVVDVAASDEVRGALFEFFARACGLP